MSLQTIVPTDLLTKILNGEINLSTDVLKCILVDPTFTFDRDTVTKYSHIGADELPTGNGYTLGGQTLTSVLVATDAEIGESVMTCDTIAWAATGGDIGPTKGAVIYDDTHVDKLIIAYISFGESITKVATESMAIYNFKVILADGYIDDSLSIDMSTTTIITGGNPSIRQTVLSSALTSGLPSFISAGAGLSANIAATATPIRISFADGFDENGAVEKVGSITADASIDSLTASQTNFLYAERNSGTGVITLGKTIARPEYSSTDPKTVSSWPPALSSTYVKATGYYSSMYPSNAYALQYPLTGSGGDASRAWMNAATGSQRFHFDAGEPIVLKRLYYSNYHNAGASTSRGAKNFILQGSNSASSFGETTYATDTGWTQIATGQFEKHAASDAADLKTIDISGNTTPYRYYALKILDNWGDGTYVGFRTVEFQGLGLHWFDTANKLMYEWSGAEWGAKQVVFLGEAVTDGSGVTNVVNYALKGEYVGDWTANPGTNVAISKNHNIGTTDVLTDIDLKCLVAEYGYSVGDIVKGSVGNASAIFPLTFQLSKTAMSIYIANMLYITALRRDTGIGVALTPKSWNYRFKARRSF